MSTPNIEGTPITVTATATDPAGTNDTLTYTYEVFKDGATTPFATNSGVDLTNFVFTPDDNGSYQINLVVTDEDGGTSLLATQTIAVDNDDPTAAIATVSTPNIEGTPITVTATATIPQVRTTR